MPEVLPDHVPSPRTLLAWDGTAYRPIHIDALGNVQIDVVASALPAGAATEATLATLATEATLVAFFGAAATEARLVITNTLLTQIASLRNALQSLNTDALQVRGENQLFSIGSVRAVHGSGVISGAGGYIDSLATPANAYDVITTIAANDATSPCTEIAFANRHDGVNVWLHHEVRAFPAGIRSQWQGMTILDNADTIRAYFIGALAGDTVAIDITGYRMTVE